MHKQANDTANDTGLSNLDYIVIFINPSIPGGDGKLQYSIKTKTIQNVREIGGKRM